ncbi:hypothetical protein A7U60_g2931 [Sanghuangporus baumii]|uniref:Uncharacterized protein n=1 Tax=Sanghuangporus baumii TaxID=108892 RepID=A0A9Q5I275_SANBA|nr:hypothetical protein A7U60_g2931 [Sanghuangporus baumii]
MMNHVSCSEMDGDDEDGFGLAQHTQRLLPVREMDAAGLAEFLRAEATWTTTTLNTNPRKVKKTKQVKIPRWKESVHESDDEKLDQRDYSRFSTPSGSPEIDTLDMSKESDNDDLAEPVTEVPLTSTSEAESNDELGRWDRDEGDTLYSVADFSEESADEEKNSEQGMASTSMIPEPPSRLQKKSQGRLKNGSLRMSLQCPVNPLSRRLTKELLLLHVLHLSPNYEHLHLCVFWT